ncbi:putative RNA-directed DNA polymerase, eukaryota, reverse transcriptase zinc-binding domain protein [Tanacetum coccineum]
MNKNNAHFMKKYEENKCNLNDLNIVKGVKDFANSYINVVQGGTHRLRKLQITCGVNSWFSSIQLVSESFSIDERVAWIDIEGVPLRVWSRNTFAKISSNWGSLLYEGIVDDPYFHRKRLCIKTSTYENIFDSFKIIIKGKIFWIRVKEVSGWAPDFSDSNDDLSDSDTESIEIKSNDGFFDKDNEAEEIPKAEDNEVEEVEEPGEIKSFATKDSKKEDLEEVHSEDPFNIYDILEKKNQKPMLRVNQKWNQIHGSIEKEHGTKVDFKEEASYSVSSCHFEKAAFLKQEETKMEQVELFDIRSCWGNLTFEFVVGPLVGNSREGWKGDVIVMGDFNEVRTADERFGSIFNVHGAAAFNSFISTIGLVEVLSGGYSYTWAHKSAAKMSKLDCFLIYEDLMSNCPNISSIILDRYLSDHRPILLRELKLDFGPTPFHFFHHWFKLDGFDSFVSKVWKGINVQDSNDMLKLAKKLKILKGLIRSWVKDKKDKASILKNSLKKKIADIDSLFYNGEASSLTLEDRSNAMNNLINLERMKSIELAQKAKIQWSIDGDENSKNFHGIINKKCNNLAIRGITVDGKWIEDPIKVKNEFLAHFKERFDLPCRNRLLLDMIFPNKLSTDQSSDLERPFSTEEIKGVVWDCGLNKSPGPDGFTFDFYRNFWSLLEEDVVADVNHFFLLGYCQKGGNSSFIKLIPKSPGAKLVKDFRPISLIGSLYKIIAKLLANRLVTVVGDLVNEVQSAFIANRQILDGPFILNEIINWCKARKKQSMIFKVDFEKAFDSVRWDFLDDILKNFGFGLKQGDPLSPLLFILVMESLHLSFHNFTTAGLFNGISLDPNFQLSHIFYADDVVFLGQWSESNLSTIIQVLDCFFRASRLRINLHKSKLIGIAVDSSLVDDAANKIGCMAIKLPFSYLGINIGDRMSRIKAWDNVINNVLCLPIQVLKKLESIRCHFFNGVDPNLRKMTFVKWNNVLASKEKALHGTDGALGSKPCYSSNSSEITQIIPSLQNKGIDLLGYMQKKLGNGEHTMFWEDSWKGEVSLKNLFPRIYSLETDKSISVASKLAHSSVCYSLRRIPRGGDGEFSVSSIRCFIDDKTLATVGPKTRWNKYVPSKVNILAWRIKHDFLPTCLNISRRDIARWWDVIMPEMSSYEEWWAWIFALRFESKKKKIFEGLDARRILVG